MLTVIGDSPDEVAAAVASAEGHRSETALVSGGQRRINLIWEVTQAAIALTTIVSCMVIFLLQAINGTPTEFPPTLSNMAFAVLAFYLARTNHERVGGVGPKSPNTYQGR